MGAMAKECDSEETYNGFYFGYTVSTGIIFVFQALLFVRTIVNLKDNDKTMAFRIMYIILQLLAISFLIFNILLFGIDPHTHILQNTPWCSSLAYARLFIPGLFYGLCCYMTLTP